MPSGVKQSCQPPQGRSESLFSSVILAAAQRGALGRCGAGGDSFHAAGKGLLNLGTSCPQTSIHCEDFARHCGFCQPQTIHPLTPLIPQRGIGASPRAGQWLIQDTHSPPADSFYILAWCFLYSQQSILSVRSSELSSLPLCSRRRAQGDPWEFHFLELI